MDSRIALLLIGGAALLSIGSGSSKKLFYPVKSGRKTSSFGERVDPISKKKEFHNGIDIAVPKGTTISAIDSGIVSNLYYTDRGGMQLIVKHDSGMVSGFAHLARSLVKKGEKVKKGDPIALSGSTGETTGAHLHLSLRNKEGKYIDPEKYFKF